MDFSISFGQPASLYGAAASANAEAAVLGKVLPLLHSTDVWFVSGQDQQDGAKHALPSGLSKLTAGAGGDPHLPNVNKIDSGGQGWLIGFFADEDGQQYFMLTNLYHADDLVADQAGVTFQLLFDSSINEVLYLNRLTGEEVIEMIDHQLLWTLPGGTGDLFSTIRVVSCQIPPLCYTSRTTDGSWMTAVGPAARTQVGPLNMQRNGHVPMPLQVVINDVGWRRGHNGSAIIQFYRTGIDREHVAGDYRAIVNLWQAPGACAPKRR